MKILYLPILLACLAVPACAQQPTTVAVPGGAVIAPAESSAPATGSPMSGNTSPAQPAAPKPTGPVHIAGGVIAGNILTSVPPVYPAEAKAKGISGTVILKAIISRDGTIVGLRVISGAQLFRPAAMEAVRQWTYKPYLLNGVPTDVDTTVTVNFNFSSDRPRRIFSSDAPGLRLIHSEPLEYPAAAERARRDGQVIVLVLIGTDGHVKSAKAISGPEEFQKSATDAALNYRFQPYLENGDLVEVELPVTVTFKVLKP